MPPGSPPPRGRRNPALVALLIVVALAIAVFIIYPRPSNEREWIAEQARIASATFSNDRVTIRNVRNFRWREDGGADERWDERTYDLGRIESVWFVLTPFATDWRGPAHAFLSFGFADSQYVAISIEARREAGETYSIMKGMLKRFELMYVIGDEMDLIGGRVLRQGDDVHVYPVRASPEAARDLFVSMVRAADRLAARPEWYGSLRNNCTTRILRHVNAVAPRRVPYGWRVLLPGYSDELALERGLLDTELPIIAARERFRVNDRVRTFADAPDFPIRIRNPEG